jgi:cytoplasmic iron level regulating protein YaaA (DUF328/UPF0246 family)
LSFLAEAQPRLENRRGQKVDTFWQKCTLNFLSDHTQQKKDIIGKITNLFSNTYIDTFINTY